MDYFEEFHNAEIYDDSDEESDEESDFQKQ